MASALYVKRTARNGIKRKEEVSVWGRGGKVPGILFSIHSLLHQL